MIDRQLGVRAVQAELTALSVSVEQLLSHAVLTNTREPLAALLADVSALAAWHALDQGNVARSWDLHERAKSAAREANDLAGLAHAMGQQAYALLDLGQATDATQLVRTAREAGRNRLPRLLQSWLAAAEAEFCAAMGDAYGARTALADAAHKLDIASDPGPAYISLDDAQLHRWRGNVLVTLRDREAISELLDARAASKSDLAAPRRVWSAISQRRYSLQESGPRRESICFKPVDSPNSQDRSGNYVDWTRSGPPSGVSSRFAST